MSIQKINIQIVIRGFLLHFFRETSLPRISIILVNNTWKLLWNDMMGIILTGLTYPPNWLETIFILQPLGDIHPRIHPTIDIDNILHSLKLILFNGKTCIFCVLTNIVPHVSPKPNDEHNNVSGFVDNSSAISDTISITMEAPPRLPNC